MNYDDAQALLKVPAEVTINFKADRDVEVSVKGFQYLTPGNIDRALNLTARKFKELRGQISQALASKDFTEKTTEETRKASVATSRSMGTPRRSDEAPSAEEQLQKAREEALASEVKEAVAKGAPTNVESTGVKKSAPAGVIKGKK